MITEQLIEKQKTGGSQAPSGSTTTPAFAYREFAIPLPSGAIGSFKVPFPSTPEDYEAVQKAFTSFKDGLVKKPDPIVIQGDGWKTKAITLAEHGFDFDLHGFDFSFDIAEASQIAKDFNLQLRFDPTKEIAFFRRIAVTK